MRNAIGFATQPVSQITPQNHKREFSNLLEILRSEKHWILSGEVNWLPLELVREVCQIFKGNNQRAFRYELLQKAQEHFEKDGMIIDIPYWMSSKIWKFRKELANGFNQ